MVDQPVLNSRDIVILIARLVSLVTEKIAISSKIDFPSPGGVSLPRQCLRSIVSDHVERTVSLDLKGDTHTVLVFNNYNSRDKIS